MKRPSSQRPDSIYSSLPSFLVWAQWLSWYRYSYEILIVNQWSGIDEIDCPTLPSATTTTTPNPMAFVNATSMAASTTSAPDYFSQLFRGRFSSEDDQLCTYLSGQDVIDKSGFDEDAVLFNVAMLFVMILVFRIMAFFALFARSRRNS